VQTYPAIEHIVMDGGSTDGSVRILQAAPPPLIWESSPDRGQTDAINRAFARSTGDIIGWLNSDDAYFSRDVVAKAVSVFENHPEVGVVYGHATLVNGAGTVLHALWAPRFRRAVLRWFNFICQPTVFVRRSALGRLDFVNPAFDYMMDRELWLHLSARTHFRRLDQIVAIDRHHLQRKSYMRLDLANHDRELLLRQYQLPRAGPNRFFSRCFNVGVRFAGLSLVAEAAHGSDSVVLDVPSVATIAVRQVAQLRRWMPPGDK